MQVTPEPGGGEPGAGDPTTGMGLVQAFGSALSSLMGGLSSALQFILGLPEVASFPTGEVWDAFKGWVMTVFRDFQQWVVETFHPKTPTSSARWRPSARPCRRCSAAWSARRRSSFRGSSAGVGMGSTFQERLTAFLNEVKNRFVEIATFCSTRSWMPTCWPRSRRSATPWAG